MEVIRARGGAIYASVEEIPSARNPETPAPEPEEEKEAGDDAERIAKKKAEEKEAAEQADDAAVASVEYEVPGPE